MVESKKTQVIALLFLLLIIVIFAKAIVTGVNHMVLSDAIYAYHVDCIEDHRTAHVSYKDKEDYYDTLFRWWDWGYKRILDKYEYPIIEPYIWKE